MPTLPTSLDEQVKLRLLLYGPAKTKKTWLAGTAAEAGFNVIYLDSEEGFKIFKHLSPEAQKRIYRIDITDTLKRAVACEFMTYFCKYDKIYWDEARKRKVMKPDAENVIELNHSRLDTNTVLVLDSYTELVWSLAVRYATEQNIDLSDAEKTDWDGYRWTGTLATWIIEQLVKLPCHVVVIGHATEYEKRSKDQKTIEWSRTQLKSTSGPHAMTLSQKFDDVLYFHIKGSSVYVDVRADKNRDSGGRVIPPAEYKWEDVTFENLCRMAGVPLPPKDLPPVETLVIPEAAQNSPSNSPIQKGATGETTVAISNGKKSGSTLLRKSGN